MCDFALYSANEYKVISLKPEKKKQIGRPRHRWEDIIIDFKEIFYGEEAFTLVSCLAYSSTLKMEVKCSPRNVG
jgi:hypothetical protein